MDDALKQEVRHKMQLKDQKCRALYDKLTSIFLEMPNFNKAEGDLQNNFDKWMHELQQHQHTIVVTDGKPIVLTAMNEIWNKEREI